MKFDFKINNYYLVGYTMISKHKPFSTWRNLEERIWKKYKDEPAYYFLNSKHVNLVLERIQIDFSKRNIKPSFLEYASILEKIYQEIFKSKEFKRLLKETEIHLSSVKNQWTKNERKALEILKEISGLPIPKNKIVVYITHPKSCNGKIINKNTIAWGHRNDWKNYATVYLCHELLHIMTWPGHFKPHYEVLHALICLAVNNELRIRLNKRGRYFKEAKFNTATPETTKLGKKILPYWKEYLGGELGKNILELKDFIINQKIK